jgi:hypothetical protein
MEKRSSLASFAWKGDKGGVGLCGKRIPGLRGGSGSGRRFFMLAVLPKESPVPGNAIEHLPEDIPEPLPDHLPEHLHKDMPCTTLKDKLLYWRDTLPL